MPSCLINMDLRKDYDTLNWDFLKDMMTTLNFPTWFVKRVMTCVSSSQYSLIMHGNPLKPFKAKRGVRRGNPMSPLLFVIGMKYLLRILKAEDEVEDFKFHPRCSTLKLNHLVFANDLILFCKGDTQSIQTLYQGVQLFSSSLSLEANYSKSGIYLARVNDNFRMHAASTLDFTFESLHVKYLRMPLTSKRYATVDCEYLVDSFMVCQEPLLYSQTSAGQLNPYKHL